MTISDEDEADDVKPRCLLYSSLSYFA